MTAARTAGRSRAAVRSLPQEVTGPLLRLLPRRRVSMRATVAVSSAMFFAVLAGGVTIQAQRIEGQHRLDGLSAELVEARAAHRELRAQVAIAESPDRIMAEATARGLVEPGPVVPLMSVRNVGPAPAEDGTTAP